MIEAGIIALAILGATLVLALTYKEQQDRNRNAAIKRTEMALIYQTQFVEIVREIHGCNEQLLDLKGYVKESNRALAPLCESLAESLTARMSTIDYDMADLRTRVERATGTSTLSL